jgi:glycosyltransferase involved in cell wall biosynthesis
VRILHWYPNFLHGGAVTNTVMGLAGAQSRQGSHVVVAAAMPSSPRLDDPIAPPAGVDILEWHPVRTLGIAGQGIRLVRPREFAEVRAFEPDLVHVHGDFLLENLWVSRLFRCPIVISKQGFDLVALAKSKRGLKKAYLAAESFLLKDHVWKFHALTHAEAEHLAAYFPGASAYCVPQGPSVMVPDVSWPLAAMPTGGEQKLKFLYVGRLDVFQKGLDILLEAFQAAASRWGGGARMHLTLAGPDFRGGRTWLERRATELGIRDKVEFTGTLTGAQVRAALGAADIYVQLSRYEGFSLSVVEALLASKPAVVTDATGPPQYPEIASLPHIRVVPPCREAAAQGMIETAEGLQRLTRAALSCHELVAEFFSWDRVARLHLNEYTDLVRAGADSRPYIH